MESVTICNICGVNKATQTGSHIHPFSLVREVTNFRGEKKRDKELVFSLSTERQGLIYQGRSILPEKLEQVDQHLQALEVSPSNFLVSDNILCPICESKLSIVESYFAEKVLNHLENSNIFNVRDDIKTSDNINLNYIRIFVLSLFFRSWIVEGEKIASKKNYEQVKSLLNKALKNVTNNIKQIDESLVALNNYNFLVIHTEKLDEISNGLIGNQAQSKNSHACIIGRYIFILFINGKNDLRIIPNLFGIKKFIRSEMINKNGNKLIVGKIFKADWNSIIFNTQRMFSEAKANYYIKRFKSYHLEKYKKEVPNNILNRFKESMSSGEGDITEEEFKNKAENTLKSFYRY